MRTYGYKPSKPINRRVKHKDECFWRYVHARQEAWYNYKILGRPHAECTDDPVIRLARLANVYRELDRNTQFAVEWMEDVTREHGNLMRTIFELLVFRFFNRIETHQFLASSGVIRALWDDPEDGEGMFVRNVTEYLQDPSIKLYTGAYMSTYCRFMGGEDGVENAAKTLRVISEQKETLYRNICAKGASLEDVYDAIEALPIFGKFLAYQCALDFTYPLLSNTGMSVAPCASENWIHPGNGAKAALDMLEIKGSARTGDYHRQDMLVKRFAEQAPERFRELDIDFRYLKAKTAMGWSDVPLTCATIGHALGEWQKYMRIKDGSIRKKSFRHYQPLGEHEWRSSNVSIPAYGDPYTERKT